MKFDGGNYNHGAISLPRLDAIAAKAKGGRLRLALTNLDATRPVQVELKAAGVKQAAGEILVARAVDSVNTFAAPTTVTPKPIFAKWSGGRLVIELPAHSVAVIALESRQTFP